MMTLIIVFVLAAAAFAFLVHKYGLKGAVAAIIVGAGATFAWLQNAFDGWF